MMRDTSADMRCTISRGTPAGAIMAAQVLPSGRRSPAPRRWARRARGQALVAGHADEADAVGLGGLDEVGRRVQEQRDLAAHEVGHAGAAPL